MGVLVVALAVLVLYLARAPLLTAAGRFLIVEDPLEPADVILVLAGNASTRPQKAAELHRDGWAPAIVIPRPEDTLANELDIMPNFTDAAVAMMQQLGVPRSSIVVLTVPGGSTSTVDDVRMFRGYAVQHGVRRAIVVTSNFHARRTRWALRKVMRGHPLDIMMAPAEDPRFDASNWWKHEDGLVSYAQEYLKWIHNASRF